MYRQILYPNQLEIIKILDLFSSSFYLAGGTAIALRLGHRKSLDFDLFSSKKIESGRIIKKLKDNGFKNLKVIVDNKDEELTLIIDGVKVTFLYYPFEIELTEKFEGIKMPSVETLCAMKFYTLGRRGKWKDYVDIYSILKRGHDFNIISRKAEEIFGGLYNEKLLREQLVYFEDIDYSEKVDFIGEKIDDTMVLQFFKELIKYV